MLRIVVDTNVLVSALLKPASVPALVISFIFSNGIVPMITDEIFEEYEGVLARPRFKALDRASIKAFLRDFRKKAVNVKSSVKLDETALDPDDNKFLECAFSGKADYLITGNTRHFPMKKFRHTQVVTPSEFIAIIGEKLIG